MLKKHIPSIYLSALVLLVFMMVALPKLILIPIILLSLISGIGLKYKEFEFTKNKILILIFLFYVAYLIGAFYTRNLSLATVYLENKLSFVIFPILFSFKLKKRFNISILFLTFIAAVFFVSILGLVNASYCNLKEIGKLACYTSTNFSYLHHPTYFALFLLSSIFMAWFAYFKKWKYFQLTWIIPITLCFLIFYLQCFSLAAMLFLILFLFVLFILFIRYKFGNILFFSSLLFIPVLLYFMYSSIPYFKVEFNNTISSTQLFFKSPKTYVNKHTGYHTGNEERLIMWAVTIEQIKEHPFGVGTGNLDEVLVNGLKKHNQFKLAEKNYNPHNQFLQTTLEIGIFGLLILLLIIVQTFKKALKDKNWILLFIIVSLIFNSLFESMLQRQSGIVFYTFWLGILSIYSFKFTENES